MIRHAATVARSSQATIAANAFQANGRTGSNGAIPAHCKVALIGVLAKVSRCLTTTRHASNQPTQALSNSGPLRLISRHHTLRSPLLPRNSALIGGIQLPATVAAKGGTMMTLNALAKALKHFGNTNRADTSAAQGHAPLSLPTSQKSELNWLPSWLFPIQTPVSSPEYARMLGQIGGRSARWRRWRRARRWKQSRYRQDDEQHR